MARGGESSPGILGNAPFDVTEGVSVTATCRHESDPEVRRPTIGHVATVYRPRPKVRGAEPAVRLHRAQRAPAIRWAGIRRSVSPCVASRRRSLVCRPAWPDRAIASLARERAARWARAVPGEKRIDTERRELKKKAGAARDAGDSSALKRVPGRPGLLLCRVRSGVLPKLLRKGLASRRVCANVRLALTDWEANRVASKSKSNKIRGCLKGRNYL